MAVSTDARPTTDWIEVGHRPEWATSDIAAYRIWGKFDGFVWWQRHEWRHRDGTERAEDWIRSFA